MQLALWLLLTVVRFSQWPQPPLLPDKSAVATASTVAILILLVMLLAHHLYQPYQYEMQNLCQYMLLVSNLVAVGIAASAAGGFDFAQEDTLPTVICPSQGPFCPQSAESHAFSNRQKLTATHRSST